MIWKWVQNCIELIEGKIHLENLMYFLRYILCHGLYGLLDYVDFCCVSMVFCSVYTTQCVWQKRFERKNPSNYLLNLWLSFRWVWWVCVWWLEEKHAQRADNLIPNQDSVDILAPSTPPIPPCLAASTHILPPYIAASTPRIPNCLAPNTRAAVWRVWLESDRGTAIWIFFSTGKRKHL